MEMGICFGIGFALGFVFALNLSRLIWPEYDESIWERKSREKSLMDDAIEEYKRARDDESEYGRRGDKEA